MTGRPTSRARPRTKVRREAPGTWVEAGLTVMQASSTGSETGGSLLPTSAVADRAEWLSCCQDTEHVLRPARPPPESFVMAAHYLPNTTAGPSAAHMIRRGHGLAVSMTPGRWLPRRPVRNETTRSPSLGDAVPQSLVWGGSARGAHAGRL